MIEYILFKINSIPSDKIAHFASGIILFGMVQLYSYYIAFLFVILAAIIKEIYDYFNKDKHTCDIWDAVATIFGGVFGLFIKLT